MDSARKLTIKQLYSDEVMINAHPSSRASANDFPNLTMLNVVWSEVCCVILPGDRGPRLLNVLLVQQPRPLLQQQGLGMGSRLHRRSYSQGMLGRHISYHLEQLKERKL